ncbi:protein OS-9-like [Actinia tenebrosa]|uniref:Protein OS-9-like n=1 Tax=Actinia tenebrosa TaxID=6105 RepID=A0A6P8I8W2_ACTTE|nr:protein OS-9-like [Actinia tenebrosa]
MAFLQRLRGLLIFTVCSSFITGALSILNLDELHNNKYGIEITNVPVLLREDSDISDSMLISSKHGQQYQCTLPQIETEETIKDARTDFTTEEVTDLLKSMQNRCLYHNKGWWMYEFCYGKSVSQYHEEANKVVGEKMSLGVYSSETDWSKEKIELPYSKNSSKRFHSQFFVNGTKCDLNGELRSTQVKFKCEPDSQDHVTMVDEPSSCTYVVVVHTEKLCNHPLFKPPADNKPLPITCSPALPQDHYQMYLDTLEREKKAKAKALADKIKKLQELDEDEDMFDDITWGSKERKPRKSELWPWNNPGVENNDETWLSGNIGKKSIGVSRMDIIKGRILKNDEDVTGQERTVTITSRGMNQDRKPAKNNAEAVEGNVKKQQKQEDSSNMKTKKQQTNKDTDGTEAVGKDIKEGNNEDIHADNVKEGGNKDIKLGVFTPTSSSKVVGKVKEDEESKTTIDGEHTLQDDLTKQQSSERKQKKKRSLEEEWKEALTKARDHFQSVVRKQLEGMGVDPDELEERVKFMKGFNKPMKTTVPDKKKPETKEEDQDQKKQEEKTKMTLDPTIDGLKAAVDKKLENLMQSVTQKEEEGKLEKNSKEKRVLANIKKIMQGMDHQNVLLMKKEETLQRELENHFEELRDRFNMELTIMKRLIDDIEQKRIDAAEGEEEDYLKNIVEKLKTSVHRFDASNKALSKDMEAVKELNKEVHNKIDDLVAGKEGNRNNKGSDFFRLAAKANLLLRRLLQRSAQLDKDMRAMKEVSDDIKARKEEYFDDFSGEKSAGLKENAELEKEAELRLSSIVQRLKKMFKGLNEGNLETDDKTGNFGSEDPIENQDMDATGIPPFSDDSIRVRVTKIKGDDGKTAWSEGDDKEKGKAENEMGVEERLMRASKRMEKLVKKQLKSAGISPGGKIRVKIITSRDALDNLGSNKGTELLSDEETNQFKDMIMTLMGGSPEAGNERKRQAELENNYNLVWGENKMKKAPPEQDEEPDAELVFDDTDGF